MPFLTIWAISTLYAMIALPDSISCVSRMVYKTEEKANPALKCHPKAMSNAKKKEDQTP
jgi:hypothetical protein